MLFTRHFTSSFIYNTSKSKQLFLPIYIQCTFQKMTACCRHNPKNHIWLLFDAPFCPEKYNRQKRWKRWVVQEQKTVTTKVQLSKNYHWMPWAYVNICILNIELFFFTLLVLCKVVNSASPSLKSALEWCLH